MINSLCVAQSGSASALGAEGRGFKSLHTDQNAAIAQLVEQLPCKQQVGSSSLSGSTIRKEEACA